MHEIKKIVKKILGKRVLSIFHQRKFLFLLKKNKKSDYKLYKKHSTVFKTDTFFKKESEITLLYHALEKGFLHETIRYRFGVGRIEPLLRLLEDEEVLMNIDRVQVQSALSSLCNYYELHKKNGIDISDFFSEKKYNELKTGIKRRLKHTKEYSAESYFSHINDDFYSFSNSRSSIRSFSDEKVPLSKIEKVIDLANNAPSVCNRQPTLCYLVEKKEIIDKILEIQGGLTGYSQGIKQLFVLTCNRNYFFSVGERNQLYIDGGIYLMNLLYSLHYHQIVACPLHWGKLVSDDVKVRNLLNLPESLQIISLIAIGLPSEKFKATLSLRRGSDENLKVVR